MLIYSNIRLAIGLPEQLGHLHHPYTCFSEHPGSYNTYLPDAEISLRTLL